MVVETRCRWLKDPVRGVEGGTTTKVNARPPSYIHFFYRKFCDLGEWKGGNNNTRHQKVGRISHAEFLPIKTIHLSYTIYDISIKINDERQMNDFDWRQLNIDILCNAIRFMRWRGNLSFAGTIRGCCVRQRCNWYVLLGVWDGPSPLSCVLFKVKITLQKVKVHPYNNLISSFKQLQVFMYLMISEFENCHSF